MKFRHYALIAALWVVCGVAWSVDPMVAFNVTMGAGVLGVTVVSGSRATAGGQGIDANSRVIDMSDMIHLLDPNEAPLTAVSMKLRKAHCISPKFEWLEDDYVPSADTVADTATIDTTEIEMDNIGYFRVGDVLMDPETGETMYVQVVTTATSMLTVVRDVGGTASAQLIPTATLLVIGNANQEGATIRAIKSTEKIPQYNYTQIMRWPFGVTRTLQNSELYGGNDLAYQTRKGGIEHRIQIEKTYIWGEKHEDTAGAVGDGTTPLRFTGGLLERITSNVTDVPDTNGTLTPLIMETFLRAGFRYGPARKMFFASRKIISFLNLIAQSAIETIPTTQSFPLSLTEYVSGHGKCYMVTHNLLEGTYGSYNNYEGWGMLLDMDSVWHRYLQESDTKIRTNIQDPSEDGRKDEYLTECGLMVIQEQNHSLLRNVVTYASS